MDPTKFRNAIGKFYCLNSSSRIKSFEGLRAFAVLSVFNVHFFAQYYKNHYFVSEGGLAERAFQFLHAGFFGVDLFFVLSGFLIYSTLSRNDPDFRSYMAHRIKRIVPAHVVTLIAVAALVSRTINWRDFVGTALFLPSFFPTVDNLNFVTWSLGWEWLFYISMFAIYKLGREYGTNRGIFLGSAMVLLLLLAFTRIFEKGISYHDVIFILPEPGRFAGFFVGVLAAILVSERRPWLVRLRWEILLPLSLLAVFSLQVLWSVGAQRINDDYVLRNAYFLSAALSFGLIVVAVVVRRSTPFINWLLQLTLVRIVGQISYSFYLTHAILGLGCALKLLHGVHTFWQMCAEYLLGLSITFVLASLLFYFVERPYFVRKRSDSAASRHAETAAQQA